MIPENIINYVKHTPGTTLRGACHLFQFIPTVTDLYEAHFLYGLPIGDHGKYKVEVLHTKSSVVIRSLHLRVEWDRKSKLAEVELFWYPTYVIQVPDLQALLQMFELDPSTKEAVEE